MGGPGSGRRPGGGKKGKGIKLVSGDTFHPPKPWSELKIKKSKYPGVKMKDISRGDPFHLGLTRKGTIGRRKL